MLERCAKLFEQAGRYELTAVCLQENLTDLLERCAKLFEQAERYELTAAVFTGEPD